MTLCAIWTHEGSVALASDSRLSGTYATATDVCIKVARVPVRWHHPTREGATKPEQVGETVLGLCFAGSFITSYTVKEAFYELFNRFQYVPPAVEPSMDLIVGFLAALFTRVARSVCLVALEKGEADIFVAGFCPKEQRVRSFLLQIDSSEFPIKATFKEIDVLTPQFIGSGAVLARKIMADAPDSSIFRIVRTVINDEDTHAVGGPLQFGRFDGPEFFVYGVEDYEILPGKKFRRSLLYRGIDIDAVVDELAVEGVHPARRYIFPFEKDIKNLLAQGYEDVTA